MAKITDVLELIVAMTTSSKIQNREIAMLVLRNLAFYHPNKPRLLASGEFEQKFISFRQYFCREILFYQLYHRKTMYFFDNFSNFIKLILRGLEVNIAYIRPYMCQ